MSAAVNNGTWSERDFKHVLTRWNVDGLTAGQIAREIGRTRNAVCGLINRHRDQFDERTQVVRNVKQIVTVRKAIGSPPGRPGASAAEVDAAARMWMSGLPVRDMAERLGKSLSSMKHLIMKNRSRFPKRYDDGGAGRRLTTLASRGQVKKVRTGSRIAEATDALFTGEGIPLVKLTDRVCKYPISGEKAAMLFCGALATDGSWCGHHATRVFEARAA